MSTHTISARRMHRMIRYVLNAIGRIDALDAGVRWDADLTESLGELALMRDWLLEAAVTDVAIERENTIRREDERAIERAGIA